MTLRFFATLMSLHFMALAALGQVDWSNTSDWRLYKANSDNGGQFNAQSSDTGYFIGLRPDSVQYFLTGFKIIPADRSDGIMWQGDFYASCKMDGHIRFLRISRYGGFFLDLKSNLYYEIPMEKRAEWHLFLTKSFMRIDLKT